MQQAVRDALIGFMAATASGQAEATKAAQRAGIEHAKQNSDRAYLGRKPSFSAINSTPRVPCWAGSLGNRTDCQGYRPEPTDHLQDQGRSGGFRGCFGRMGRVAPCGASYAQRDRLHLPGRRPLLPRCLNTRARRRPMTADL
jgi:hypothetical protein